MECVVDPSSLDGMGDIDMMGFSHGQGLRSWVDMLVSICTFCGVCRNADYVDFSAESYEIYLALRTFM
jgi:hypothetical protein